MRNDPTFILSLFVIVALLGVVFYGIAFNDSLVNYSQIESGVNE